MNVKAVSQMISDAEREARVLLVDDDLANLHVLGKILRRAGFSNLQLIAHAEMVTEAIRDFDPDVVLLDMHMPGVDGVELIAVINQLAGKQSYLPILVVTADSTVATRDAALAAGAKDFLTKPYNATEVVLRVRNLVETRLLHVELQRQNASLSAGFAARTAELETAKLEILERLARASDFRDESTHAHTTRVGELSARIAQRLGLCTPEVEQLRVAARLHDVGKIGLSDSILQKPAPLTPEEFQAQERHTIIGAMILAGSNFPVLRVGEQIALSHHEAWDGTGYPSGLSGEGIPLAGRIVAVADVFDALTHARPYKDPWTLKDAVATIKRQSGRQFDPRVVDAFVDIVDEYSASAEAQQEAELIAVDPNAQRPRVVRDILRLRTAG